MNTISWSVILTLLYKKNPEELRSENIQISSQIWQSTEKENFFFSVYMTKCYTFETIILFLSQIQRKKVLVLKYGFQQHYVTQC